MVLIFFSSQLVSIQSRIRIQNICQPTVRYWQVLGESLPVISDWGLAPLPPALFKGQQRMKIRISVKKPERVFVLLQEAPQRTRLRTCIHL